MEPLGRERPMRVKVTVRNTAAWSSRPQESSSSWTHPPPSCTLCQGRTWISVQPSQVRALRHRLDPHSYRERYGLPADYPMVAASYAEQRSALARPPEASMRRPGGVRRPARPQSGQNAHRCERCGIASRLRTGAWCLLPRSHSASESCATHFPGQAQEPLGLSKCDL
jgi:hypothetical protein